MKLYIKHKMFITFNMLQFNKLQNKKNVYCKTVLFGKNNFFSIKTQYHSFAHINEDKLTMW